MNFVQILQALLKLKFNYNSINNTPKSSFVGILTRAAARKNGLVKN